MYIALHTGQWQVKKNKNLTVDQVYKTLWYLEDILSASEPSFTGLFHTNPFKNFQIQLWSFLVLNLQTAID